MQQFLAGIPAAVKFQIPGQDGPITADSLPTATFNGDPVTVSGTGPEYTASIPAAELGEAEIIVSAETGGSTVTYNLPVEFIGGYLFSIAELRAVDEALEDTQRFPNDYLRSLREYVDEEFYRITGRYFTPRRTSESSLLIVGGDLYLEEVDVWATDLSLTVDGTEDTGATVDPIGVVTPSVAGSTASIAYTHGFVHLPADIKRAALLRAKTVAYDRDSGIPDRATSFTAGENGVFTLATAGRAGFETGIPDVDAILNRYAIKPPGVA